MDKRYSSFQKSMGRKGKYAVGEFLNKDRPDYTELYEEIIKKAQGMGGNK